MIQTEIGRSLKFVASKTRVAPIQRQTIPRLELLSALILARLMDSATRSLSTQLPLSQSRCFTDSMVSLYWIQGVEKQWKPFVQNRVNEIRKLLPAICWSHCSGRDNPADIPSRGLVPLELSVNVLWRRGPSWLDTAESDTSKSDPPESDSSDTMPDECAAELKAKESHCLLTTDVSTGIGQLMKIDDFSNIGRLYRVTAYVLRFIKALKAKKHPHSRDLPSSLLVSAREISDAEKLWIIDSQKTLRKDKNFILWTRQFGLFQDDSEVWRCGGRLSNASIPFTTKHPIFLNKDHYLTSLIIRNAHQRVAHDGVKETLTELRSKYWVVRGRKLVKFFIHRCQICRRFEGQPCRAPPPPPLPEFRVEESPPFTNTGVDFAGPLFVKGNAKVWICLYTCCVVRAVHLDIVPDMSAPTFICSLKRFTARRGLPRKIISDNGKTFKAAAKVLHKDVQQYLAGIGVEWIFNLERAPWWGGVFERMVRSTKRCLKKMIGQAKLSYDELLTAVTEVEAIINSRPLTFVSSDDIEESLTPSHFLIGRRVLNQSELNELDDYTEVTPTLLSRRLKYFNTLLDKFWKRWRDEYLLELRDSHRYSSGGHTVKLSVGDIVVVHSDGEPRGFWRLAKVERLIAGRDDQIRGAELRVSRKGNRPIILRRPLQRLYPLEISTPVKPTEVELPRSNESEASDNNDSVEDGAVENSTSRPSRAAAVQANDRIRACISQLETD